MKTKTQLVLAAFFAALLVGCASTGENFDQNKVSQIKKGETTETELLQMFGEPQSRSVNSEGQTTLTWMYTQSTVKGTTFIPVVGGFVGGTKSKTKTLNVTLQDGKVHNFSNTGGGMDSRGTTQDVPNK